MKIGLLIRPIEDLENWELRIIDQILECDSLKIEALFFDSRRKDLNNKSIISKISRNYKSNLISKIIYSIQLFIESKIFIIHKTVDVNEISEKLKNIKKIFLNPKKTGFIDFFNENETNKVSELNLDLILRHEFQIIRGGILNSSKYGIWSFHHGDNRINRGGPPGFWEIVLKQKTVGVTLQQLTPELDGGKVIDRANYNRHWSLFKLQTHIKENSVSLLMKNIRILNEYSYFKPTKSLVYSNPLYKKPNIFYMFIYLFNFYLNMFKTIYYKLERFFLNKRRKCWTLFIGKGDFINSTLFRLKPIFPAKNEFWADPFLFKYQNDNYVFFENYNYNSKKAKISCGLIKNNKLTNVQDVLDLDYHLSFPFIFEDNGDIYMIPETHENKRLEVYKSVQFPNKWKLFSTSFEDEEIIDPVFYRDEKNTLWLFLNKKNGMNGTGNSDLFIYKIDSMSLKNIQPHKFNPVIINSKTGRNAGRIYKKNNKIFRPSQINIDGVYGKGLNINMIKKISIDEYEEENIVKVFPNFKEKLIATHHLDMNEDYFIIDGAFDLI